MAAPARLRFGTHLEPNSPAPANELLEHWGFLDGTASANPRDGADP
jgi:hypothetical protein